MIFIGIFGDKNNPKSFGSNWPEHAQSQKNNIKTCWLRKWIHTASVLLHFKTKTQDYLVHSTCLKSANVLN